MGLTTGIDTYVTTEEADAYIAMHYLSTDEQRMAWENAGDDKEIALRRACAALDSLMYRGVKFAFHQALSFPRYFGENYAVIDGVLYAPETDRYPELKEVPQAIKAAQIEEALEMVSPTEATGNRAIRNDPVQAYSIGHLSETYIKAPVGSVESALASVKAQALIRPYTGGGYEVR